MKKIIYLLFCCIILLGFVSSEGDLCEIKMIVNDYRNKSIELNDNRDNVKIFGDTVYEAICLTNEKVRNRNLLSLTWFSKNDKHKNHQDFQQSLALSNSTFRQENLFYLKSYFTIDSSKKYSNYLLTCRFLTVNPSVYCETDLKLIILSSASLGFSISFVIFIIFIILIVVSYVVVKFFHKKRLKTQKAIDSRIKFNCGKMQFPQKFNHLDTEPQGIQETESHLSSGDFESKKKCKELSNSLTNREIYLQDSNLETQIRILPVETVIYETIRISDKHFNDKDFIF